MRNTNETKKKIDLRAPVNIKGHHNFLKTLLKSKINIQNMSFLRKFVGNLYFTFF